MPSCPSCRGMGKIIDKKFKATIVCPDCDGKCIISDKTLAFINYYKQQKQLEAEIAVMENDTEFLAQYERAKDA